MNVYYYLVKVTAVKLAQEPCSKTIIYMKGKKIFYTWPHEVLSNDVL